MQKPLGSHVPIDPRKAHILGMFRAIDANAHDELPHYFAADIVYERPGYQPIAGLDALGRFYSSERMIASGRHEIAHLVGDAHRFCAIGHFRGRLRNGDDVDLRFCDLYELVGDRIANRTTFFYTPCV